MKVTVLASGSRGNCTYIEGESGALLIDAGLSAKEIFSRLDAAGGHRDCIEAVLVTHEHTDHLRGADVIARRLGIPVVATAGTLAEFSHRRTSAKPVTMIPCTPEESLEVGNFSVRPFSVFHDALEPCGFRVRENGAVLGCCTDTGKINERILDVLRGCDALILESNHCPDMLENGPYPAFLKRRIRSDRGHLSNAACAECLNTLAGDITTVLLAHLSEENNTPEKARASARSDGGLGLFADTVGLHIGRQHEVSETFRL